MEINFQEIREQQMPDGWREHTHPDVNPDNLWKQLIAHQVQRSAYAMWSFYTFIQDLGWVEHTDDWDWYVQITYTDGRSWGDHGEIQGMIDSDGTLWDDAHKAAWDANWHHDDKPHMVAIRVYRSHYNEDTDEDLEETLDIPLDDITTLTISYD
jgi:hypothetical protein